SMMRGRSEIHFPCLPDHLAAGTAVLWLHGGEGRFDNQEVFWQRHGFDRTRMLTVEDFPVAVPRTGWGVGDRELIQAALRKMDTERSTTEQMLSVILTVTNHIPWALPDPASSYQLPPSAHRSHQTTRYADEALGDLIVGLKQKNRWEETLLIVMSDHGNLVPPPTKIYANKANQNAYLLSHISFAIGGGIAEDALMSLDQEAAVIETPTSQAAVAPF